MDPANLRRAANDWLKEFAVALKNVTLYSESHPRGRDSLSSSYRLLKPLLEGRLAVTLGRAEGRLTLESVPLDRDRAIASKLYDDLNDRGIRSIEIAAGVTLDDYTAFVRSLLLKPEKIHEQGGLEAILLDEGVGTITVNKSRIGKVSDAMDLLTDLSLMDLLSGRGGGPGGERLSTLMAKDPAGLARALAQAAGRRDPAPPPGDPDFRSEQIADSLDRMAERALEEEERERPEILQDLGRILAACPPELQARIMREKVGPRSHRRSLTAAVEQMSPETLAEVVSAQYTRSSGEHDLIQSLLMQTMVWQKNRQAALGAVEKRLLAAGSAEEASKEILDHLMWAELDVSRRLQLLYKGDNLWSVDFQRVKEVLVKLFGTDQVKEATTLIQKYLSGLLVEDASVRRLVAENARYILHLIEKTGKGLPMLVRIGDLFMARLQDEEDTEVQSRLAAALGFLADLRLRDGECGAVLELMRRADELGASSDPATQERAGRLGLALGRIGNAKVFKDLTDQHLRGEGKSALEAAEVLRRTGTRAVDYLVDRLAEEEDRGNRARLVSLLKEMERSSIQAFTARLEDPRWFLVRNVVHILGELGDLEALPALKQVGKHPDPRVRKEAVRSFMRLGGPECEDQIVASITDRDRSVQVAAVNALSVLRGRRSEGIVLDILRRTGGYADLDPEVRLEAVGAAGRMGLTSAVEPLAAVVLRKGLLGHAEPLEMRLAAVHALGSIEGDEALEALRTAARTDSKREVREAAGKLVAARGGG